MRTRKLGRTGLEVSEIGFGALEIGRPWGLMIEGDFSLPAKSEVKGLLDRALDLGINFFDTAPAYMLSEERLGHWLKHHRKKVIVASKCGEWFNGYSSRYDFSAEATVHSIEESLRRLQTDYLDLVQIHCGPGEEETVRRGEALEGMLRACHEGKVRYLGVSCHASGALAALEMGSYEVLQVPYSLLNRAVESEVLGRAEEAGVGIIVREALERGKLTPKIKELPDDDPRLAEFRSVGNLTRQAVQFPLAHSAVSTVLIGTRNPKHLEEAVRAAEAR